MSPDKTVDQVIQINGRALRYKATVGHIDVHDDKGKTIGQVVYTAYVVPGAPTARPVTFAFNGGPGASSVFLNMGAIGPKKVGFGVAGRQPVRPGRPARQSEHLARLHRPRLHRSGRHRILAQPGRPGRDQEGLLRRQDRHPVPEPRRLRLAGRERPPDQPQIPDRRELRRLPRAEARLRAAEPDGRRRLRHGDGLALSRSRRSWRRDGAVALALDDQPAGNGRGPFRAPGAADAAAHGGSRKLHAHPVRHRLPGRNREPGGDRPAVGASGELHRARSGAGPPAQRPRADRAPIFARSAATPARSAASTIPT